jgi:glycosyltransferase involved in cell wall biosynthesis
VPDSANKKLSVLHLVLSIGETNTTYNEHCLPVAGRRDLAICTYFQPSVTPPDTIALFRGDGSLRGFFRALRAALSARQYDAIHAHSPHVAALLLVMMLLGYGRLASRTVVTVHDSYPDFKLRNRLLFIPVFATFRRVVCCSRASYTSFPRLYRWLAGDRLGFVQNGVDLARIDRIVAATGRRSNDERFTVAAVSRLVGVKNPHGAIEAFHSSGLRDARLVYIGDGPLREPLLKETTAAGLQDRVEFTGLIPRDEVFEHLLSSDLYISTSRGEGLPVAVLEAMACRRPVVLSDIPPHREIAEGVAAIPLVAPDDADGFAREIRKFHDMTKTQRADVGRLCRHVVEQRFSLDAMHAGYERVYIQLSDHGSVRVPLQESAAHDS